MAAPDVTIYEVGPRDGLQNEPETVPTAAKLELIQRLGLAGLRRIEATSFVSPRWIPQLADAADLAGILPALPDVVYSALVPNPKGYERFREAGGIQVAACFISASETHNRKNVNCSVDEQIERIRPVAERCREDRVPLRSYVSTVCGCPYEGAVSLDAVVALVAKLLALGIEEISLGDTIGVGHPGQVRELVAAVAAETSLERIALHMHDTYGRALANVQSGYEAGVRIFDTSLGGLGGCPYAPGASGNVATEDVVDLFERAGIETGVDLDALVDTTAWLERAVLQRPLPGRVYRARLGAREHARGRESA
ncbi:MAG: hydroxymethylglutaryl-CoA lyase [Proteobacteria bacterium]|nr:hydroxymethylglutaryl-CoA lyase [Pseudomonadota bacterium]